MIKCFLLLTCVLVIQPKLSWAADVISQEPPRLLSADERASRIAVIKKQFPRALEAFDRRLATANHGNPTLRDLPNAALAKLVLGRDPHEAEELLKLAFAQQNMEESSKEYGFVPWQLGHPEIADRNSDEFTSQALGPILTLYGDKLSPAIKQEIQRHAKAFFAAMNRREFKTPAYTNIYLMRSVNMILLGEAAADSAAADEGYRQLDAWIDYTKASGIREFDSPTYYYVDLDSLSMGYALAARAGAKEKFKAILDYFWTDIAANYFVQRGCISGANSRNYDFLHSWGGIDYALFTEGFRSTKNFTRPDFEKALWVAIPNEKAYRPGEQILALTKLPQRIVRQRWDPDPQRDRYQFLTPDFSISSSNGDYGAQDKQVAIELASSKPLPVITIIPDVFDAPYGKTKSLDRSGHSKATHLKLNPTILQEKNLILAMIDLDMVKEQKPSATVATNILLPAMADRLVLDGRTIQPKPGMEEAVNIGSVIAVRDGNAGAAIRVFLADGADQSAAMFLKMDPNGLTDGVARLAIYHYRGDVKQLTQPHLRVGLILMAGACHTDAEFDQLIAAVKSAKVEETTDAGVWTVKVETTGTRLEAGHDLKKRAATYRKVNGTQVVPMALEVNGEDLAAKIWGALSK